MKVRRPSFRRFTLSADHKGSGGSGFVRFAEPEDYAICRQLHRRHGTTYYLASRRFPPVFRDRTDALYGFVRVPDEWVDNPGPLTVQERAAKIREFRDEMRRGVQGHRPSHPVLRAFCDVIRDTRMPLSEPEVFLDAMEADLHVQRYATYEELRGYMRGSASAVGVMMCYVLDVCPTEEIVAGASVLGEAMQLTNFLRDVAEDTDRGRIYLPLEDLDRFGVKESDVLAHQFSPEFARLMEFQIDRARRLYAQADPAIALLPPEAQKAVLLARILYSRILDRIEEQELDVFQGRARTSRTEKLMTVARVAIGQIRA